MLRTILHGLSAHPAVAWAERINTGAYKPQRKDGSAGFVRFGFVGCSDILGQMKTGEVLAVEVKSRSGRVSPSQAAFQDCVRRAGGMALVARSWEEVSASLDAFCEQRGHR